MTQFFQLAKFKGARGGFFASMSTDGKSGATWGGKHNARPGATSGWQMDIKPTETDTSGLRGWNVWAQVSRVEGGGPDGGPGGEAN